jgi:tripartite ATP-independent transporter DctM subunit
VTTVPEPSEFDASRHFGVRRFEWFRAAVGVSWGTAHTAVEIAVVAAVVIQLAVLFGDVLARKLANTYYVGTADLSQLNMSIIAFGGAVIADRRHQHVRMSVIIDRLAPSARSLAITGGDLLTLLIALWLMGSAIPLAIHGWSQPSPVLHIAQTWVVLPFVIAMAFIAVGASIRLARQRIRDIVPVAIAVGILCAIAWVAVENLDLGSMGPLVALTQVALLFLLVALGVPVGFALVVAVTAYLYISGMASPIVVSLNMVQAMNNFVLLAIPFFILAGLIMAECGLSRRLAASLRLLIGKMYGGLFQVVIVATFIFSGISGAKVADIVAIGTPLKSVFRASKYDMDEAAALLAASAAAGETVPPSIAMLVLGSVTSLSIGALFAAGLVPAAVISAGLMAMAYALARKRGLREDVSATVGEKIRSLPAMLPALSVPVLLVGGIVSGFATPTEVSAVAVVYALALAVLLYREVPLPKYRDIFRDAAAMSGLVLLLVSSAAAFAWSLALAQLPDQLVGILQQVGSRPEVFLLLSVLAMIILGAVLEGLPAIIIVAPVLVPMAVLLGINPLQYGVLLIICMGIGHFAPPIGIGLYVACPVMDASFGNASRKMLPYLGVLVVCAVIVAFVPGLSTWLPGVLFRH